ncbi:hypothetical protein [Blastococcus sp. SYSU DS0541]
MTVTAQVEVSDEITPGDPVALHRVSGYGERSLRATTTSVGAGEEPLWHLVATGPAERSRRRRTVRARLEVPVVLPWLDGLLVGCTVDVQGQTVRQQVGAAVD